MPSCAASSSGSPCTTGWTRCERRTGPADAGAARALRRRAGARQLPAADRLGPAGHRLRPAAAADRALPHLGRPDRGAGARQRARGGAGARGTTSDDARPALVLGASFGYLLLLFTIAAFGDRRAPPGALGHRQRHHLRPVLGRLLHRLDLLRQRRPRRDLRRLVPADLPRPDAGHAAGLDRGAQDGAHRPHLPHHLDRRLHRQPLRQEPAPRRAGHADHRRRHRPLHRAAAEGRLRRLPGADRRAGAPASPPGGATAPSTSRWRSPPSPSSSAPATSTSPSATRAWSPPSPSSSAVKLVAFLAVGAFVTWGLFDGMADIWARAQAVPELAALLRLDQGARRLRLRPVVRADHPLHALGAAAAAAVPGHGRRVRRRAAHPPRRLALPDLPPPHQPLRPAHRHRRPPRLRPGAGRPRDLRPLPAARPGRAGAGALRLHRRPLRR